MAVRAPTTTEWSEPKRGWAYCTTAEAKVPSPEPAGAAVVEISRGGGSTLDWRKDPEPTKSPTETGAEK